MCLVLYKLPCGDHIFGIGSTSKVLGHIVVLQIIAVLHVLRHMGSIVYQDVNVRLDLFFAFSYGESSVCHALFSQGCCQLCCSQGQLPTYNNSLRSVQSFIGIYSAFGSVEAFHFEEVSSLPSGIHLDKQVSISCFFLQFVGR